MKTGDVVVNVGNLTEIQNCQFGKTTKEENVKCEECENVEYS